MQCVNACSYVVCVDAEFGGQLALAYTFFRFLYCVLFPMTSLKVACSTTPNYLIIWYMAARIGMVAFAQFS